MQKDPRKRPGAANLLTHPWITAERIPIPSNAQVPLALSLEDMFVAVHNEEEESEVCGSERGWVDRGGIFEWI